MDANCATCGRDFTARRSTARYCSASCRSRARYQRDAAPVFNLVPSAPAAESPAPGIGSALLAAYSPADLATPAGTVAVRLAADVDATPATQPGYAALVRELRSALADLKAAAAPVKANPLVLMRERHAGQRASG